jgi:tetratricopeptide (TPR) repeat protein
MKQKPLNRTRVWWRLTSSAAYVCGMPLLLASGVLAQTADVTGVTTGDVAPLAKVTLKSDPATWQSGDIRLNDELYELSRPQVLRNSPFLDMVRRDLLRLMDDYGSSGVTLATALKNQKSPAERWIGYAYASAGDERAVPLLEDVLGQIKKPLITKASTVNMTYLLICLSSYYEKKGDLIKAAETHMRAFDYVQENRLPKDPVGAKVPVAGMLANQLVTAARLYKRAGMTEKATELYTQVEDFDYGWATGLAQVDEARDLIGKGKYEEARQVLKFPSIGKYSDQIELVKLTLMGKSYFLSGDLQFAKKIMQKSIDQYEKTTNLLPGEGIEGIIASAKSELKLIDGWIQYPIQSDVKKIDVDLDANAEKPVIRRIRLHTFKNVKLKATSNNKYVEARVVSSDGWDDKNTRMEVIIELKPEILRNASTATLTIDAIQDGEYKLEIQIQVI